MNVGQRISISTDGNGTPSLEIPPQAILRTRGSTHDEFLPYGKSIVKGTVDDYKQDQASISQGSGKSLVLPLRGEEQNRFMLELFLTKEPVTALFHDGNPTHVYSKRQKNEMLDEHLTRGEKAARMFKMGLHAKNSPEREDVKNRYIERAVERQSPDRGR